MSEVPYCTLAEVQHEAGNHDSDAAGVLEEQIIPASRWIDDHCKRDFLFHDHTANGLGVPQDWIAENCIWLPWPIVSLNEISVDGDLLSESQYRVTSMAGDKSGVVMRQGRWMPLRDAESTLPPLIRLHGTFGYPPPVADSGETVAPALPQEIRHAAAVIAAIFSGKLKKEVQGMDGSRQVVVMKTIPKETLGILCSYRRAVV